MQSLDSRYVASKFFSSKESYESHAIIQRHMRQKLIELLESHFIDSRRFGQVFEFGAHLGGFSKLLMKHIEFEHYICNDINDYGLVFENPNIESTCFDMRDICVQNYAHRFNLIASNACLQWLPFATTLASLYEILDSGGIVLLSSFGRHNLKEIQAICGVSLSYLSLEQMQNELCKHYEILALEEESICLDFACALEVFRHLQKSGVNSLGKPLSKAILQQYQAKFQGKITYHPIYILARKKD